MRRLPIYFILAISLLLTLLPRQARAQFKEEAFTQQYNDDADTTGRDSTDVLFSFKDYWGGIRHKHESKIGTVMAGSLLFVGGAQVYNRQYWKLPIIYGGMAAGIAGGIMSDDKTTSKLLYAGAGLVYWGAIMDGTINYKRDVPHQPGKATMYAILFPGLGQAYNGEYWKIPVYYGLMLGSVHFYATYNKNYRRYRNIYNDAALNDDYNGPVSASTALYYRNIYRRYRDYAIVAIVGSYLLQIIDANVFSYMRDFDLSDNIDVAMDISPTVISEGTDYAINTYGGAFSKSRGIRPDYGQSGLGLRIGFTF